MKKKGSKNTGYPDYYVGFYGKLNEEPIFNSCFDKIENFGKEFKKILEVGK